jgi:WD40 repeat protein
MAYSPDGQTLATGSDQEVRLWDTKTEQVKSIIKLWEGQFVVSALAFSPDSLTLAAASWDSLIFAKSGVVELWDARTGKSKDSLGGFGAKVYSLAYSRDGLTIATGSADKMVRLWDTRSGLTRATLAGHSGTVSSVKFSPDGETLASASADQTVRLWDAKTGRHKATLQAHTTGVRFVAFSPDGLTLAGACNDNLVRLWDVKTGQSRATLHGHTDHLTCIAFSPDGLTLASGSWDQTVRLWDVKPPQTKVALQGYSNRVSALEFSTDGRRVIGFEWGPEVEGFPRSREPVVAWTLADGKSSKPTDPSSRLFVDDSVATSPDGSLRAEVRAYGVVLIETARERQDREEQFAFESLNRVWWHQQQADQAEKDREWFAVAFHLGQLLKLKPNTPVLLRRRDEALEKLKPPSPMEPLPRPGEEPQR